MTASSPPPPPSDPPCTVRMGICTEQERVICVRNISKCGSCFGIAQTTSFIGMIFWSCPSCLSTFTTELSALDRISALENKLEKADSLISEIKSMKLEIIFLKKPDYPYLSAAFRNWTDSTASDQNSKKQKAEGNENVLAGKESHDRKPKVFKTGTNINHQTPVWANKRPPNSVSTNDIKEYCKNKGAVILCIR